MQKKKTIPHFIRNILFFGFSVGFIIVGFLFIWIGTAKIPDFRSINDRKILNSTKIYDRTGETLLYDLHDEIKRTVIPFETMGNNIKNATVAIEDRDFYNHKGIRPTSIARAFFVNVIKGESQGGSTITQQVIKNSLLTKDKTLSRKFKEWILSIKVDQTLGKDEILALYLNENPYGGTIYGVQEASQTFFKKNPADLTVAEAAYLAAIPQLPTYYSPYGKNRDKLDTRKDLVLFNMHNQGYIDDEEYQKAKDEVVVFVPQEVAGLKAPHFVFYVRDYLLNKYGEDVVYTGGLKVITTLDWSLQEKAEKIIKEQGEKSAKAYNANNAGLVAIDPKTGQILSLVGSLDYFGKATPEGCISGKDCNFEPNFNVTTAKRQPGSSFKPFAFATAFNKGFLPETVVFDVPTEFSTTCANSKSTCYNPNNFDNAFKGPISMRSALAESRNVPSVKTLYLAGLNDTLKLAKDMGIHSLGEAKTYGLTLVLGGGEVTLIEITSAYGVFANEGVRNPPTPILSITDKDDNLIEEYKKEETIVLPKNTALMISDVLSDNTARTPTFGANSQLYFAGRDVAAKTGTTNDNKDAWLVGYTPNISVGVWSGNNDNTKMSKGGSAIAGPIWHAFMAEALRVLPSEQFNEPTQPENYLSISPIIRGKWSGGDSYFIDTISGGLATEFTPEETKKEILITNPHSILYWVNKNEPRGPKPINPDSDSQFKLWEAGVTKWLTEHSGSIPQGGTTPPTYFDNVHTEQNQINIQITNPISGSTYSNNSQITITSSVTGPNQIKKVDYFINDNYVGTSEIFPFSHTVSLSSLPVINPVNEIKAIATDSIYNKKEVVSQFSIIDAE